MYSKLRIPAIVLFAYIFSSFMFAQSGPNAVMTPTKYDFGNIIQDSVVTLKFAITNEGDSLLMITNVSASCGCTAAMPEKNELMPGESTNINVSFDSKDKSGKQNKAVFIESNDPKNPKLRFHLTGNIIERGKNTEPSTD